MAGLAQRFEVADYEDAIELFHRKGMTDGLPIVPPTPKRVAQFLDAAKRKADDQLGFYEERSRPITAEKLAINAVMAGCLPEHFPVVIAIVEAMLSPNMGFHMANSSTSSFVYGFIINGPIRNALGMNSQGNVLGPGNRANASIGRAVRLIQINVFGSTPGAGIDNPEHGLPILDRSTMGQTAKYTGYHVVENEEAFPTLTPTHVELGFKPTDSTVTVLLLHGDHWVDAHAEKTPEEWIDSVAHYIVGAGRLVPTGCAALLIPPENARLFVDAGWTKADIRNALFEKTRRSAAWLKSNGWRLRMQSTRLNPVEPGDENRFYAVAGSPDPKDLFVVVCGGPAGGTPFYLYSSSGGAVTRKIVC